MADKVLEIYTDGACKGNPGIGGWGVYMVYGKHTKTLKGAEWETTNNRMELTAAIEALKAVKRAVPIVLHTDSVYLKDGITKWLNGWIKNNWKKADGGEVKNKDLWEQLANLNNKFQIQWNWVKGHAGDLGNELVDSLANEAIIELKNN